MSTYLSRPVFDFPKNWAKEIPHAFEYSLRARVLGFASPVYERLQSHTVQGFDFDILLETEALIDDFTIFCDACKGRLNGFWIQSPFSEFRIKSGISGTQFKIEQRGLADTWTEHSSVHLIFRKAGETDQYAAISAVTNGLDGTETVTIDALSPAVDETWDCYKLLYVRFADDVERATFEAENVQTRHVKVIELPTEYEAIETGQRPVYLYDFWMVTPSGEVHWRFTSLNENVTSNANVYTSRQIDHDGWKKSIMDGADELTVKTIWADWNPLRLMVPFKAPMNIYLRVSETTYSAPDTVEVLFTGIADKTQAKGTLLTSRFTSFAERIGRRFPMFMIQQPCNYQLFSTPCGVSNTVYSVPVVLETLRGRTVILSKGGGASTPNVFDDAAQNYFAYGYLETGTGENYEVRTVNFSEAETGGAISVQVNKDFAFAAVTQTGRLYAGCDKTFTTCFEKFANVRRFGGHNPVPKNLTVKAVEQQQANGNKK